MFNGVLNKFSEDVNCVVRNKGFWDSMDDSLGLLGANYPIGTLTKVGELAVKATKDAFISQKIALIMSECTEALEAMRKDNYGLEKKDTFEDEIADVFIRLFDLCGELNIDIEKQIAWKLKHNESRPNLHGKNF